MCLAVETGAVVSLYQPLANFLTTQPAERLTVTLAFAELRAMLGQPLPASAWGRSWWMTRTRAPQTRAWSTSGWRVLTVNVRGGHEAVTFMRVPREATA